MTKFCQLCGRPITRQGHSYRHPEWVEGRRLLLCELCAEHKPRCLVCNIPINGIEKDGICVTCATIVPICLICGKPIVGEYLKIGERSPYCPSCARGANRCDVCGVPTGGKRQVLTDGRIICEECHKTAVYTQANAQPVYAQTRDIITQRLGLSLNIPTALILVGRDQLADIFRQVGQTTSHVTQTLGVYMRKGRKRALYVQSGLPRLLMMQVIAHEWGHAWQMENAPLMRETIHKEGFAEWIAYKVMAEIGAKKAMARMLSRDDVYGQGLRYLLEMEARSGMSGVLSWCRKS